MNHKNSDLLELLRQIDLGSSIAEQDELLEKARVETSVFNDLASDKVDLIPGTKGSGKSALFRIFVEFLPDYFLEQKKVVIAHGVNRQGDSVFHAFKDEFSQLTENDFVNFWCIYIVSLAHEQFLKNPIYDDHLKNAKKEIDAFLRYCEKARIPEIKSQRTLHQILAWTLNALKQISPGLTYKLPGEAGDIELTLFKGANAEPKKENQARKDVFLPIQEIKDSLEAILSKTGLCIWFMIDKLDEIFPRRSELERTALRGLLRTLQVFNSKEIRVKIFLRDDILDQVVSGDEGFTALTHVTSRKADKLRWSEDQILTMIVSRLCSNESLRSYLDVDLSKLNASQKYRSEIFYKVFPPTVHKGERQSSTLSWLYSHTADGKNVVTPRDVIELLTKARQNQCDRLISEPTGESSEIIDSQAILYGIDELSMHKKTTYLKAEFPHLWNNMSKFDSGKTKYTQEVLKKLLGEDWSNNVSDLVSIGFISEKRSDGETFYEIPFVYRKAMNLTQGWSL